MRFRTALCTILCAAACATLPAVAALYKWTDENGRVVYGDTPPPGSKAERISVAAPPADPNAVRDMASKDAELRKRAQARTDEEAKEEKNRADTNLMRRQCQQNAARLKALRQEANIYTYDDKGERVNLDAAARQEAIAQTEKVMRDAGCTPAVTGPASTPIY